MGPEPSSELCRDGWREERRNRENNERAQQNDNFGERM